MQIRTRRTPAILALLALGGAIASCGSGGGPEYANKPRPAAPIVISASISTKAVSVSPTHFGAGPIDLVVTNQTGAAQQVTLETADEPGGGPGLKQETSPINPRDTARLSADVQPGAYRVHVTGGGIRAATVTVGKRRPSAQADLLTP